MLLFDLMDFWRKRRKWTWWQSTYVWNYRAIRCVPITIYKKKYPLLAGMQRNAGNSDFMIYIIRCSPKQEQDPIRLSTVTRKEKLWVDVKKSNDVQLFFNATHINVSSSVNNNCMLFPIRTKLTPSSVCNSRHCSNKEQLTMLKWTYTQANMW